MALVLYEKHARVVHSTPPLAQPSLSLLTDNHIITGEGLPQCLAGDDDGTQNGRSICRGLSLFSRSSFRLLSQCSSLNSLPSLGLSFHGSFSEHLVEEHCSLEAEYHCAATIKSQGENVLCGENGVVYCASSRNQVGMRALSDHQLMRKGNDFPSSHGPASGAGLIIKEGAVRAMAVMGDLVFSAHKADCKIRVWTRAADMKKTSTVADTPHKMVAAIPTLWDCVTKSLVPGGYVQVRRKQRKSLWIEHVDAISALAVSQSKSLLYSASWDRSVKVWRLPDFKCIESFKAHDDAVNCLALSRDDNFLYTGSADSKIKAWTRLPMEKKKKTKKQMLQHVLVCTLATHRSAVNALVFSSDAAFLYSGACDKAIVVWERGATGEHHAVLAGVLRGHRHAVLCLVSVGATLCSGSADKTIRVWQRVAGRLHTCVAVLEGHSAPVKSLSIPCSDQAAGSSNCLPDTPSMRFSLYSASLDQELKRWNLKLILSAVPSSSSSHDGA